MAILKQRLNRKNSSGSYDTVYLENIATNIKMSDTDSTLLSTKISNMDTAINGKQPAGSYAAANHNHNGVYQPAGSYAAASHNHSAANITSGTLDVARGGTGQTSVDTTPTSGSKKMCTSGGIYTAINELKTSVSNGKSAVASAITDKGVSTSATASFNTMATNIRAIPTRSGKSIWVSVPNAVYSTTFSATKGGATVYSSYIGALGKAKIELPGSDYVGTWTVTGTFNGKTNSKQVYVSEDTNDYFVELVFIPISGNVAVGNIVTFDNKEWRVVHNNGNQWYLASSTIVEKVMFGSDNVYKGSTIANRCVSWMNENLSANALYYCSEITVENVTNKVFIPTYPQINGEFSYYNSDANRICYYNGQQEQWWASSPGASGYVYCVSRYDGYISTANLKYANGFRPHVCITL